VIQLARSYIPAEILKAASPSELPESAQPAEQTDEPPPTDKSPAATALRNHVVVIGADGTLSGRTRRVHPQTGRPTRLRRLNVFLVQDNAVVAQAPVSENGAFSFSSVAPGTYSFVASGLEGFSAFSVQAVNADQVSDERAVTDELIVPVAFQAPGTTFLLDGVLVSPQDLAAALKELLRNAGINVAALEAANPAMGAPGLGAGAGGGGGGGGGGGSGLLGALLGAALGAGIAALADNGNGVNRQTPTTTTSE
jgi:hypothetical protein